MDKMGMYFQEYVYQLTEFIGLRLKEKTTNWTHIIRHSYEAFKEEQERQQQEEAANIHH